MSTIAWLRVLTLLTTSLLSFATNSSNRRPYGPAVRIGPLRVVHSGQQRNRSRKPKTSFGLPQALGRVEGRGRRLSGFIGAGRIDASESDVGRCGYDRVECACIETG